MTSAVHDWIIQEFSSELLVKPRYTCEIKLFFVIILKLFQCFISRVTTSETETKLFQPLKEFWN